MQGKSTFQEEKTFFFLHLAAFNVTIRSDRRGTCKGTHLVYACVGYCESSAFPSRYAVLVASNFTHNITSASRCCTISRDAKVRDPGRGGGGVWSGLTALRLLAGQSSPGLPPRPPPRRNRDPDGEGLPLRHVPQVALLKPGRGISRHRLDFPVRRKRPAVVSPQPNAGSLRRNYFCAKSVTPDTQTQSVALKTRCTVSKAPEEFHTFDAH